MRYYADLHIHSSYSRATSRELTVENLFVWAQRKGVQLLGTGDCIHPVWLDPIEEALRPRDDGFLELRPERARKARELVPPACRGPVRFALTVEISNIYKRLDKVRKVHNLVVLPSIDAARRLQARLDAVGNIRSDGRPILGLDSRDLLEMVLEIGDGAFLIPAHIWTPWFSALGSKGGFDRIADCYADLTEHIFAVETGLSSDPPMNRRLSQLDRYVLVSHSDAHSPSKLAREASEFDTELSYGAMLRALSDRNDRGLVGTVEFFPEEGKYHLDGHRACGVRLGPAETIAHGGRCPSCGRLVTVGVMARVEALADRPEGSWSDQWRPFARCVPLPEVIGQVMRKGAATKGVLTVFDSMLARLGNELHILREAPLEDIAAAADMLTAEAIGRMRRGEVETAAGYDGEFGTITVLPDTVRERLESQTSLFGSGGRDRTQPGPAAAKPGRLLRDGGTVRADSVGEQRPLARDNAAPPRGTHGELNPAQREAVEYDGARLVIVAGPGTGKTHTLIHRIARIAGALHDKRSVIAVTFTNRAANEMRERLARLAPGAAGRTAVGTFHRLCLDLLRELGPTAVLPGDFGVASGSDRDVIARQAWPLMDARERHDALDTVSAWKTGSPLDASPPGVVATYDRLLHEAGLADFDDLIREVLRLLRERPDVLAAVRARTAAVFVDEYQDIDGLQALLLETLVDDSVPLTAIGDPDQSIYGFRGSSDTAFARFESSFPGARRIRLTHSYRAGRSLLDACSQMIGCGRMPENALSPVVRLRGRLTIREAPTDKAEAEYVVHQVERLVGGTGMFSHDSGRVERHGNAERTFGDIAVLYRLNSQRDALREAFERSGIPFQVSGEAPLAARSPAPDLLALVRLARGIAVAPESLRELLEHTAPGVGPRTAAQLVPAGAESWGCTNLHAVVREMPQRTRERLRGFLVTVEQVSRQLDAGVPEMMRFVERLPGWCERLQVSRRRDVWDRLRRFAVAHPSAAAFVDSLALERPEDTFAHGVEQVSLMTLHASKGLEFPVVFIVGCEEHLVPLDLHGRRGEIAEERRLFYVGMSRAKEHLYLIRAGRRTLHGRGYANAPSRFLADIEEQLKEYDRARAGAGKAGKRVAVDGQQMSLFGDSPDRESMRVSPRKTPSSLPSRRD